MLVVTAPASIAVVPYFFTIDDFNSDFLLWAEVEKRLSH
jgi:hypothetical protein